MPMHTLMVALCAIVACSTGERSQSRGLQGSDSVAQRSADTSPRADELRISQVEAHLILFERVRPCLVYVG